MKCGIGTVAGCKFSDFKSAVCKSREVIASIIEKNGLKEKVLYNMAMAPNPPQKDEIFWYYCGIIFDSSKIDGMKELKRYEKDEENVMALQIENKKGDWYVYQIYGSFAQLPKAWGDAKRDLLAKGYKIAMGGQCHEVYVNEMENNVQEKDQLTLIYFPLDQ